MRFTILPTLLVSTAAAAKVLHGLDPFFLMYSTSKLGIPSDYEAIVQTASTLQSNVAGYLSSCPTSKYALVSLPNFYLGDVWPCKMDNLCNTISETSRKAHEKPFMVGNVKGRVSSGAVADQIQSSCATAGKTVEVVTKKMDRLPLPVVEEDEDEGAEAKRNVAMQVADAELAAFISTLGDDYTLLIIAEPDDHEPYEPTFNDALNIDIKRRTDSGRIVGERAGNRTVDHRGLFEKYQFFTPGIFMGLIALIVMFSILGVGLKALSSLQVSYGAFEKDMGPAAQKKNL